MDNEIVKTILPNDIYIPLVLPNLKVKHKVKHNKKSKLSIPIPKVGNPNSKNQLKKKAKQNAKNLLEITIKLKNIKYE